MKTVEELITRVRRDTRNATTGLTTAGASLRDAEFVDQLNDAQENCVELISGVFSTLFEATKVYTIDTTAPDYEVLPLPEDILLGTRVCSVEYSRSGAGEDYFNLYPVDIRERYTGNVFIRSLPGYILTGNTIILSEKPNQNGAKVRLVYERVLPRLDVVKAVVATGTRTGTDFTGTYTVGTAHPDVSSWAINAPVSIIDISTKTMLVRDARFSAINTGSGAFTIDLTNATYSTTAVDAATATNLRLIEGGRTNVSELPKECEKFLVAYANMEIFGRDGSALAKSAALRFERIEESLLKNYLQAAKDWPTISEARY